MKKRLFILVLVAALGVLAWVFNVHEYLTFENLKAHREFLRKFIDEHYFLSVAIFLMFYITTAFFLPGAVPATVAGGFLFGVLMGTIYVNIGAITGAALAFRYSRFLMGSWIQKKYGNQLKHFNEEVEKHGMNYIFVLRIAPVLPFFVTNYLAGVTKIPLKKFMVATFLGTLPGSLVFTFAGRQLAIIERPEDILSPKLLIAFSLLALLALSPVIMDFIGGRKGKA